MRSRSPRHVFSASLCVLCLLLSVSGRASDDTQRDLDDELALVESWLAVQRAYDRLPGVSAAIVHDQDLLWSGGFGYADQESEQPAAADTIYGICSISKLFTGIAAMGLRDQGKLRLDDPVSDLLPWFNIAQTYPDGPTITLEGLLTHASGLPRESDSPYWMGPDFPFPTKAEIREKLGSQSTLYPAERYFQYSNLGLTLVGEIVEQVSGQDYETYVREHILAPLNLHDTDTGFPEDERQSRIATGYAFPDRDGVIQPLPRYDARGITPAAGFASTALDLARFASWQFRLRAGGNDTVLSGNTLREMQRVHWMDWDWTTSWGLAFGVYRIGERTLTGHGGSCPGFNTRLYIDPVSRYGVAVMANRNDANVDGYANTVLDILEAGGANEAAEGGAPDNLDEYVGDYDMHPWSGEALVFRWKGSLAMTYLPSMQPLQIMDRLQHVEGDTFRTIRSDEEPGHEVTFLRDASGKVSHVHFHSISLPRL